MKKKIYADYKKPYINIGYTQESEHLDVYFNVAEYSGYSIDILHQRPGDQIPYPVTETRREGNYIIWTVTSTDTGYAGRGKLQLHFTLDDIDDQTVIFTTEILKGLIPSSTPSDALLEWYANLLRASDEAIAAAGDAEQHANSIKNMTVSSESLDSSLDASVTKTETDDGINLHFGIPRGADGEDGHSPVAGVDYFTDSDKANIVNDVISDATNSYNIAVANATEEFSELVTTKTEEFEEKADGFVAGGFVQNGYLYLTDIDGDVIGDALGPFAGGGGGSGGGSVNDAVITVRSTTGWLFKTITTNTSCPVSIRWSSVLDEDGVLRPTGDGTLKVTLSGVVKETRNVPQGDYSIDLQPYLNIGANKIGVTVTDAYGNARTINYQVEVISVYIESTFDQSIEYPINPAESRDVIFTYKPVGSVSKTMHYLVDGVEIGVEYDITTNGTERTYTISSEYLGHGSHTIDVYFESTVGEETVVSNTLHYDIIYTEPGNDTPIIASSYIPGTVIQYTSLAIPYYVFSPSSLSSTIEILVNGETISTQTVNRSQQIVSYRAEEIGNLLIQIKCEDTIKNFHFNIVDSSVDIEAETNGLSLYLTSKGRSNNTEDRDTWVYNDISALLSNFNFTSDGWQLDDDNVTVLRVSGDARIEIPYQIFKNDFKNTGKTIEFEFATRDVVNYDTPIISCYSGGRGIEYTAQLVSMVSEQSSTSTRYKENEHIRISFVVEKQAENRLIYFYINGIMSGVIRYPITDDFAQLNPVNISIGSNECALDIYTIRVYNNNLTRFQILNNWIADTQNVDDMVSRYERNNIFDSYGNIVISKLPQTLPYLVIESDKLSQNKSDKIPTNGFYVNPSDPEKNFTFENASFAVQGTSSAGYPRKNYKAKFVSKSSKNPTSSFADYNGNEMTDGYAMNSNAIPTKTFTFKADFASSEGANNVELVRLYNDTCTYRTQYQIENPKIRQGIDGFPIVVFWHDTVNDTTSFLGKYNFNNDKGTKEVYGFQDGDESWEFKNNTSNRTLFKSADFTSTKIDSDGNVVYAWLDDFEGRYPDGSEDATNLAQVCEWVVSTDQDAATNEEIDSVTYDGTTYTRDTSEYRLAKFKAEFEDWFELDAMTYFYIFTEAFLMVDNRAKNMFITKMAGSKWFILPYDFDTALGINNEGTLAFSYNLEDVDTVDGADVYNGQRSTLWVNFRQAFYPEIRNMYTTLRTNSTFSYSEIERRFEEHQSKWPEAIFNEDSYFKYIQPLIVDGADYLGDLQGSKAEQRKWWLYNRFKYLDSKYNAGDSLSDAITLRGYAKSNISVTPYADIYASVKYGSYLVQKRAVRNNTYELECPLDNVSDTEIYVYSCSQISSIGDISGLKVGLADFSKATRLSEIKIGDGDSEYRNSNLTSLNLSNNQLLRTIDVRNCPNLRMAIDLSKCSNIEEVYFSGSSISGISLPNGGNLRVLDLPGTLSNLTVRNQTSLSWFHIPEESYPNITTLWIENVPENVIHATDIVKSMPVNSRVRIVGLDMSVEDASEVKELYDALDTMRGIDDNTGAQVSGTIHVQYITREDVEEFANRYPNITITYDQLSVIVFFYSFNELISTSRVPVGGTAVYTGETPSVPETSISYTFLGWSKTNNSTRVDSNALTNVTANRNVYAVFRTGIKKYTINFYNEGTLLQTSEYEYNKMPVYNGPTPVYSPAPDDYGFVGWSPEITNVVANADYYAQFVSLIPPTLAKQPYWYNSIVRSSVTSLNFINDYIPDQYNSTWDASDKQDMGVVGYLSGNTLTITWDGSKGNLQTTADLYRTFYTFTQITSLDLSRIDTSNATTFEGLFDTCMGLTSLDLSGFNTTNVTNMNRMFAVCANLRSINFSGFDTANVTSMNEMFSGCSSLTALDLSMFDLSNVASMNMAFNNCRSLNSLIFNPDVAGWSGCYINLSSTAIKHDDAIALFYSLPTITSTSDIKLPSSLVFTEEEERIATGKGWNIVV